MMDLIGDDHVPKLLRRGSKRIHNPRFDEEMGPNFEDLQNLHHKPNSKDFADSPFADRA